MVSTTDAHGMAGQVERARELLSKADVDESDREAIEEFANHREVNEGVALSTLRDDIADLKRAAERADKPLVAFESVKDANALLKINADEYGVSPASNDNYRKGLRNLFNWLDSDPDYGSYEWFENIKIPARETEPLDPNEVLSMDEVQELRQAADHPREKALIEFLADTGMRITAALQVLRGDVDGLEGDRPTVAVNRDGEGQKGMDPLPRPVIHSQRWLRQYLNEYHPEDHPQAPLFASKYYDRRERDEAAIHPTTSLNKLKELAEAAGLDRDRVNNHGFRHVATTRMRREMGMDWDDIAHRTGWSAQSLSRMKELYGHLTNEDKNERLWNAAGQDGDSDAEESPASKVECINCGRDLSPGARYCVECGADQDSDRAEPPMDERAARKASLAVVKTIEQLGIDTSSVDSSAMADQVLEELGGPD